MAQPEDTSTRLGDGICRILLEYGHQRVFAPDTRLIQEGAESDAVYAIVTGEADVLVDSGYGRPHYVARLGAGAVFGEIGIFHDFRRTGSVDAATELEVIQFNNDDFMLAVTKLPELNFRLLSSLSWKVEHTNRQLATGYMGQSRWALAFHLLRQRFYHLSPDFTLDVDAVAHTLNVPRHNIRALLDEFAAEGALEPGEINDQRWTLRLDPAALERLMHRHCTDARQPLERQPENGLHPWL